MVSTEPINQVTVGVLALQGAFIEHIHMLRSIPGVKQVIEVRTKAHLESVDCLIIPGGESSAMALIAERSGMLEPLRQFVRTKPTWGTCAGMIMLSDEATNAKQGGQELLGGLHVRVNRNQFGSQKDSFKTNLHFPTILGEKQSFPAVFIRAPVISKILDDSVEVLSRLEAKVGQTDAETIVAVRQGNMLATAFHPELTSDNRLHQYFVHLALQAKQ
ncbi:SNO glutamine amidotransferase [Hesseltinella vesiculosa]|uniref:SNO glutamine amidotransferase n=1 Tax=Hesseltinella vesiculosa TaxID=101127 RepID=A0A1X2GXX6_9FUNG|nr:SNO glutamine amidotransferase [Hesseltinella vesiculosa]